MTLDTTHRPRGHHLDDCAGDVVWGYFTWKWAASAADSWA